MGKTILGGKKMNQYRTHTCGELTIKEVGKEVKLSGWIQKIRNLGGMTFLDIRDQYGITQIVLENDEIKKQAEQLTTESSICVSGIVVERKSKNDKLSTGEIEVIAQRIEMLGKCKNVLPFEINTLQEVREDLRLEYRFLDLRSDKIHRNILLRSQILKKIREQMDKLGFCEIQTPILANSSPEGARDFLVPSRLHPGEFYALPQAPQQFKQLLMVSGFDKYYQIAPCFRDEDPRADRAPGEFYQLDFEMCYAQQEDVLAVIENVVPVLFKTFSGKTKIDEGPFVRIAYEEAMEKYGIDKPDLRNPLIIQDISEFFKETNFNAFKEQTIKLIVVPEGAKQPRKFFDHMTEFAKEAGAKGLAWTKIGEKNQPEGGIAKFITQQQIEEITKKCGVKEEDSLFFIADEKKIAQKIAGLIRIELGKRLDLMEKDSFRFCFIVDFPMYELSEEGAIDFNHNPFSMPQGGKEALETKDPLDILAYQFDLVCNGYEMASGAVRNHDPELMVKAFEIAGYTKKDVEEKFGALYHAFEYGTPPHAGAAPGIDRMIMLICGEENLREVIAFPKNKKARDVMMGAPSHVTEKQLQEVHIQITEK